MHLRWPERSKQARVVLFSPLQDIDIYVEDVGSREFYKEIFRRVVPKSIRVKEVFEAGGKEGIRTLCSKHDFSKRPALFIIDGDFQWVRGEPPPENTFRLDAYCIENLLIDPTAIVEHVFLLDGGKRSREQIAADLALRHWLATVTNELEEIFLLFAVANKLTPSIKTVSRGLGCVIEQIGRSPEICKTKVHALCGEIRQVIASGASQVDFDVAWNSAVALNRKRRRRHDIISGKDFLLPLLRILVLTLVKDTTEKKSFYLRLATNCSRRRFSGLKKAVISAVALTKDD